jgi:hypothetical protein
MSIELLTKLVEMSNTLVSDQEIPNSFSIDGRTHVVISTMKNFHYRVLVLPVGGEAPKWLSNDTVRSLLNRKNELSDIDYMQQAQRRAESGEW